MKYKTKHADMHMKAHVYFTEHGKDLCDDLEEMGMEVTTVDPFGGYVAPSKDLDKDLTKAGETIKERFQMDE